MLTKSNKKTHVIFCMDISGSMDVVRDEVIGMYNSQLETLKKEQEGMGNVDCSLVFFGLEPSLNDGKVIKVVYEGVSINELVPMTRYDYMPQGMTPMRDGIGRALNIGESFDLGDNDAVLLVVLTDGHENNSQEWSAQQLADKMVALRATDKWTIQVMGANIDFTHVKHFGIEHGEFSKFSGSAQSVMNKSDAYNDYLVGYADCRGQNLTRSLESMEDVD